MSVWAGHWRHSLNLSVKSVVFYGKGTIRQAIHYRDRSCFFFCFFFFVCLSFYKKNSILFESIITCNCTPDI